MIRYLLDTDIIIYTMKNKPPLVREAFELHHEEIAISSVTLMELYNGVECSSDKPRNLNAVEGLAARLSVVDFDVHAASHTGEIRADLAGQGTPIGPYDAMIAGHARSRGLTLVPNNEKEFERVDGLRLENWAK
ncbi:plasmid maintenance protein [Chromatiales bacterium (ex Bugula neritina AB1)]|nr:plasmid maintenance protein [Chromatiales bacterium (ex Bugula neritina AB1)]